MLVVLTLYAASLIAFLQTYQITSWPLHPHVEVTVRDSSFAACVRAQNSLHFIGKHGKSVPSWGTGHAETYSVRKGVNNTLPLNLCLRVRMGRQKNQVTIFVRENSSRRFSFNFLHHSSQIPYITHVGHTIKH